MYIQIENVSELRRIINVFFSGSWQLKLKSRSLGYSTMFAQQYLDERSRTVEHLLMTADLGDSISSEYGPEGQQ